MLPQFIQEVGTLSNCWNMCMDVGEMTLAEETQVLGAKFVRLPVCPPWEAISCSRLGTVLRKLTLISGI